MVEANERIADALTGAVAVADPQTGWTDAQQGNGVFSNESVQGIIRECYASHASDTQRMKPKSEEVRQVILNALMLAIEARLSQESELELKWKDTHLSNMLDRTKPDGILSLNVPDMGKEWRWTVAVFEIRNDYIGAMQASLRGQLLLCMVSMSQHQPRLYSLGFTGSKDGDLYIYLVMPAKVFYSKIGRLPLGESGDPGEVAVVRLLLLMYQMLPKYPGFLATPDRGIFSPLTADKFIGIVGSDAVRLSGKTITVLGDKTIGGRNRQPVGSRSWIYRVHVAAGRDTKTLERILKFHWYSAEYSESQFDQQLTGELLLLEDAGKDIRLFFKDAKADSWQMIDVFAGYFHALLVAATGNEQGEFIIHRDISAMNLLIKDSQPFVIDWGNGVHAFSADRITSKSVRVGTAPFMGIRALNSSSRRSLVDDVESLFLVFSYCLWSVYGKDSDFMRNMWQGKMDVKKSIITRRNWLTSKDTY
ncbi:hypothetical protein IW136_003379 [Coemansia sp. RSA 678]|nr:hypothetical protein IW136_003379 [Coemansia sp. RSA 678]